MHADLVVLGHDGSYSRVAAFVRAWKDERQRDAQGMLRACLADLDIAATLCSPIGASNQVRCLQAIGEW